MRQPNGRMSKKDRRAIEAFGLVPSDATLTALTATYRSTASLLIMQTSSGTPLLTIDRNGTMTYGPPSTGNWYLSVDPSALRINVS